MDNAYELAGWDALSPYARGEVDRIARENGVMLAWNTPRETLERFIRIYRATGR
jgi:hypothetical protein